MKKPDWLKVHLPSGPEFTAVNESLRRHRISTVCSSARCPNLADCWNRGTTTFLILGDTCTRHCRFCSVKTGNPHGALDESEPERVAQAVAELGIAYVVLTSVDRDDLPDLGARQFARTVQAIRHPAYPDPQSTIANRKSEIPLVEVLTPDFGGREELLQVVVDARPTVFGHNLETVGRTTPSVRDPRASYRRSLEVLRSVKKLAPAMTTKSGLMVGLGETANEVSQALRDLRAAGCDIITIGQYLQAARNCIPVQRYYRPEEFTAFEQEARALGFSSAFCGPLVRSSYHAEQSFSAMR